ncbi:3',5'-cyclic AMP phosphodiesterase CpdA [Nitrobacteraceae bacterium AZCC 2146]
MTTHIALISDIHLSRQRPYFHVNWEILLEELAAVAPELVLVAGDLSLDGPHHSDDLAFARAQLDRMPCPWLAVPGNHDVGNNLPDVRGETTVTGERVATFRNLIGPDFWLHDVPGWRIIGLDSLICGSGLAAEQEQAVFLRQALDTTGGRKVALMYHKPFCLDRPDETAPSQSFWYPQSRALLGEHLSEGSLHLLLSGHLHESRDRLIGTARHIWAPGVAFVSDMTCEHQANRGGRRRVGWMEVRLGDEVVVALHEPLAMMNTDIGNWLTTGIGHYAVFAGQRPYLGLAPAPAFEDGESTGAR